MTRLSVVAACLVIISACDPGAEFVISNPCPVEIQAAVFLDRARVPSLTSYRKLVRVPAGGTARDADFGVPDDTIALVVRDGKRQQVFELPHDEEVTIPDAACE